MGLLEQLADYGSVSGQQDQTPLDRRLQWQVHRDAGVHGTYTTGPRIELEAGRKRFLELCQ